MPTTLRPRGFQPVAEEQLPDARIGDNPTEGSSINISLGWSISPRAISSGSGGHR